MSLKVSGNKLENRKELSGNEMDMPPSLQALGLNNERSEIDDLAEAREAADLTERFGGVLDHLPIVADATLPNVDDFLSDCQDLSVLLHYLQIFYDRFASSGKKEYLDRQISTIRSILHLIPEYGLTATADDPRQSMESVLANGLLARFRIARDPKDAEESADISRRLLTLDPADSSSKELLFEISDAQADLYDDQASASDVGKVDALRKAEEFIVEALGYLSDDDRPTRTRTLLKLSMFRSKLSLLTQDEGSDLLNWAKRTFEDVWKAKHLIQSDGGEVVRRLFIQTLINLYAATDGGVEYLERLAEVHRAEGASSNSVMSPQAGDIRELSFLKGFVLYGRFLRSHDREDLLLATRYLEDAWLHADDSKNDYVIISRLLMVYETLYTETQSREAAERCGEYARILADSPSDHPMRHGLLRASAMGFMIHFSSGCPNNIDSLRKAANIVLSDELMDGTQQNWEQVAFLGMSCKLLFETTWYMPTIDAAIFFLRLSVEGSEQNPTCLDGLARVLLFRQMTLRSVVIRIRGTSSVENPSIQASNGWPFGVVDIFQTEIHDLRKGAPSPELLAALHEFNDEGDEESETLRLLNDASYLYQASGSEYNLSTRMNTLVLQGHISRNRDVSFASFKEAISILQRILISRPSLRSQRSVLDNSRFTAKHFLHMPLQAASVAIGWGEIRQAVEFLEYGRSLVWSRMRGLRAAEAQLLGVNEHLRSRFVQICEDLEKVVTLEPPPDPLVEIPDLVPGIWSMNTKGFDQPSNVALRKQELEEQFDLVVDEIRRAPSYKNFLQMIPFDKLQSASQEGPIIILVMITSDTRLAEMEHDKIGHAIIICDSQTHPVVITLGEGGDFEDGLMGIKSSVSEIRKNPNDSNDKLWAVLKEIGRLFVKNIVVKLRSLGVKQGSRIWWCPTSFFSAFPIHAAMWQEETGDGKSKFRCLSDYYVSSYTPSLTALINARTSTTLRLGENSGMHTRSPLLIVGQRDEQLVEVGQEIKNIALAALEAGHTSETLTSFGGDSKVERDKVLSELQRHGWIHFACHGILDPRDPFASYFQIGEGEITLMDIIKSRVTDGELAFLANCHSAEQLDTIAQDEALHLAAGMQHCGFRSVVGTMWAMGDEVGPLVAKAFYEYMFVEPKGSEEVGYKRSARALNKATRMLRNDKRFKQRPELWVNFVHIGA